MKKIIIIIFLLVGTVGLLFFNAKNKSNNLKASDKSNKKNEIILSQKNSTGETDIGDIPDLNSNQLVQNNESNNRNESVFSFFSSPKDEKIKESPGATKLRKKIAQLHQIEEKAQRKAGTEYNKLNREPVMQLTKPSMLPSGHLQDSYKPAHLEQSHIPSSP